MAMLVVHRDVKDQQQLIWLCERLNGAMLILLTIPKRGSLDSVLHLLTPP